MSECLEQATPVNQVEEEGGGGGGGGGGPQNLGCPALKLYVSST